MSLCQNQTSLSTGLSSEPKLQPVFHCWKPFVLTLPYFLHSILYSWVSFFFLLKNIFVSSAFLCSPVAYVCFHQLSIESQPCLFSKLSLLKWQQWLYNSAWKKDKRTSFSLNFIQASLSSVHTDYSNKVWLSYHFHGFDFLTGREQIIPFFFFFPLRVRPFH